VSYYLSTVAIYFGVDLLAAWGLNMQFGWAGIPNFAFIIFQAVGAYVTAVLTLGPDTGANSYQHYVLGMQLPFPLPLLAAAAPMAAPMRASPVVGSVETSARVCGKTPAFAGACMVAVGAAEFDGDLPRHRRHPSRRGGDLRAGTAPVRHPRVKPKDKHSVR